MHSFEASLSVMHTLLHCKVYGQEGEAAIEAAFAEVKRLESVFSRFLPDSEVSKINAYAGKAMVDVSDDTLAVLGEALAIGELSGGLFDVTIAPLMNLWDFTHTNKPPSQEAIDAVLPLVDYHKLVVDSKNHRAGLTQRELMVDLGGLAKGYAADCAKRVLKERGIQSAYINLGGNVQLVGSKWDNSPWKVGIRHPRVENSLVGSIAATDVSVVTSGDYERFFIASDQRRYHHLVNPKTGYPGQSGIISLTVVCKQSLHADALSTALFLAGLDGCKQLLVDLPGVDVFAIDENLHCWITASLVPAFQPVTGLKISLLTD